MIQQSRRFTNQLLRLKKYTEEDFKFIRNQFLSDTPEKPSLFFDFKVNQVIQKNFITDVLNNTNTNEFLSVIEEERSNSKSYLSEGKLKKNLLNQTQIKKFLKK